MKICIGTYGLMSGNGLDLCAYQQSAQLAKLGHEVSVYTFGKNLPDQPGVEYNIVPQYTRFWKTKMLAADELDRRGFDFFMAFGSPFFMLAPHVKNNVIIEFGTPYTRLAATLNEALFFNVIRQMTLRSANNPNTKLLLAGSQFIHDRIASRVKCESFVSHSGIEFPAKEGKVYETGKPYVLYVGRHVWYKQVHRLAKIFSRVKKRVPDAELITVGRVDPLYQKQFDQVLKKYEGITALGYVEDIWPLYRGASVYATCSLWEGEDRPVLEAQYVGTPAVAFNNCCHAEVIHHGKCVNDERSFENALVYYLKHNNHSDSIGNFIAAEYAVQPVVNKWLTKVGEFI